MKGIILAGGSGTRLYPITQVVCKQLLPVYDKPMIYYPLSVLMLAGIREILVISTPSDLPKFNELLGDGSKWGISLFYCEQPKPEGIPQAFILGENFIGDDAVCLILGDNIFYGQGLVQHVEKALGHKKGGVVFGYWVKDPERYGVLEFDSKGLVKSVVEKPLFPASNWAVTGIYFFDNRVIDIAAQLTPSKRGELEIADVINSYLQMGDLSVEKLGRGIAWLDTGTHKSLMQASSFIEIIEERQGLKVACLEEIAYHKKYIDANQLEHLAAQAMKNDYGKYLMDILKMK